MLCPLGRGRSAAVVASVLIIPKDAGSNPAGLAPGTSVSCQHPRPAQSVPLGTSGRGRNVPSEGLPLGARGSLVWTRERKEPSFRRPVARDGGASCGRGWENHHSVRPRPGTCLVRAPGTAAWLNARHFPHLPLLEPPAPSCNLPRLLSQQGDGQDYGSCESFIQNHRPLERRAPARNSENEPAMRAQ